MIMYSGILTLSYIFEVTLRKSVPYWCLDQHFKSFCSATFHIALKCLTDNDACSRNVNNDKLLRGTKSCIL
jgi:hypothetical protein